jgi:hypothetical protein
MEKPEAILEKTLWKTQYIFANNFSARWDRDEKRVFNSNH